jgi:hypothetical protein
VDHALSSDGPARGRHVLFVCEPAYRWYLDGVIDAVAGELGATTQVAAAQELPQLDAASARIDLIVTIHSSVPAVLEFCERRRGITPSLTVQDGIIEHRSSSHRVQRRLRFQPLCTDRIAVFGDRSARLVELYGTEPGRIAVTGSPRFDAYFAAPTPLPAQPCLLITTANRSAYGQARMDRFYRLLVDLLRHCERHAIPFRLRLGRGARETGTEPIEKVTSGLGAEDLQFFRALPASEDSLLEDLRACSAVITTPSTVSLEAMALGRPVAHLLFDAEAVYLQSAWTIARPDDFAPVIADLLAPPAAKAAFQRLVLRENLLADAGATRRVVELIRGMLAGPGPA